MCPDPHLLKHQPLHLHFLDHVCAQADVHRKQEKYEEASKAYDVALRLASQQPQDCKKITCGVLIGKASLACESSQLPFFYIVSDFVFLHVQPIRNPLTESALSLSVKFLVTTQTLSSCTQAPLPAVGFPTNFDTKNPNAELTPSNVTHPTQCKHHPTMCACRIRSLFGPVALQQLLTVWLHSRKGADREEAQSLRGGQEALHRRHEAGEARHGQIR